MAFLADDVSILAIVDLSQLHGNADRTLQLTTDLLKCDTNIVKSYFTASIIPYLFAFLHYCLQKSNDVRSLLGLLMKIVK